MSADDIRSRILNAFCSMLDVAELRDGSFAISTPFLYGDGDAFPIILEREGEGWRFTDRGASGGHLYFDDLELTDYRLNFMRRVAAHDGLRLSPDFVLTSERFEELPDAVALADFVQAVARIGGVVGLERPVAESYTRRVRRQVQDWISNWGGG